MDAATTETPTTPAPATSTAPAAAGQATSAAPPASWHDSLPDGLKAEKTLRDFKDPAALAQSYLELKRWQSGASKIPGADAKPDEVSAFHEKLGRPKSPEGYALDKLAHLPIDKEQIGGFFAAAHKANFTQAQVDAFLPWAFEREQKQKAAKNEANLQAHDKLADEWGKAVYDHRVQLVQRVVDRFASPEDKKYLESSGLTNDPALFRWLVPIAEQFAEDRHIDGTSSEVGTPEQITDGIAKIRAEMAKEPEGSPRFNELLARLEGEYKKLHPVR